MAQKGLWNLAGEKVLRERGALPKEKGDVIGECKAMHEDTFPEQLVEGKMGKRKKKEHGNGQGDQKEERGKKRRREEKREDQEQNETGGVKRR